MLLWLTESQVDRAVNNWRSMVVVGGAMVFAAIALPQGWGIGLLSGFMLFSLGIYGMSFRRWKTEPGIWMLAVLLTVLLGPCWVYFELLQWRQIVIRQAGPMLNWNAIRLSIDGMTALLIFTHTLRLAITVSVENWKRTRQRT